MEERIVNRVYLLALELQKRHPNWGWDVCCEVAFQQNRLDNHYS